MKRTRWLKSLCLIGAVLCLAPFGTWILNWEVDRLLGIQANIGSWVLKPNGSHWIVRGFSARTVDGVGEISTVDRLRFRLDSRNLLSRRLVFDELILENAHLVCRGARIPQVDLGDVLDHEQKKFPIEILTGPRDEYWATVVRHLAISGLVNQVRERWHSSESMLDQKISEIESQLQSTRSALQSYDNPLRDIPALTARQKSMKSVRQGLPELETEVRTNADRFVSIASEAEGLRRSDLANIESRLAVLAEPREKVAEAIINDFIAELLGRYHHLGDVGLQFNELTELAAQAPARGKIVPSAQAVSQPEWEVRRASFAGKLDYRGTSLNVLGRIENLVPQAFLASQPTKTRLQFTSSAAVTDVHSVRFMSFPKLMDIVEVQHREQHPRALLATLPQLEAHLSAGDWLVSMQWEHLSDEWIGQLRLRANDVGFQIKGSHAPSANEFMQRANDRLTAVNKVTIEATVRINQEGNATCEWKSDLLAPLRNAFQHAHRLARSEMEAAWLQSYRELEMNQLAMIGDIVEGEKKSLLSRIDNLGREVDLLQRELALAVESANSSSRYSRGQLPDRIVR